MALICKRGYRSVVKPLLMMLALSGLAIADEATVSTLVESLRHEQPETRRAAALKLGYLRAEAENSIDALIVTLNDPDSLVACRAVEALTAIHLQPEPVIAALSKALTSEHPSVRIAAAAGFASWPTASLRKAAPAAMDAPASSCRRDGELGSLVSASRNWAER